MKIAFVTVSDGSDLHDWSGTPHHMMHGFRAAGHEVVQICKLQPPRDPMLRLRARFLRRVLRQHFTPMRSPSYLHSYARQVEAQLQTVKPDLVFSPGTIPVSYLQSPFPVVTWTDSTFAGMIDYYPEFTGLHKDCIRWGNQAEQAAADHGALLLYGSDWAAKSALQDYKADPAKVHVVPLGANLQETPDAEEIERRIAARPADCCRLLFIGVDWKRKGGSIAVDVARELNRRGLRTELDIVGVMPPAGTALPDFVHTHGFISKRTPEGRNKILGMMMDAHLFILPSRAECFGVVFAESNAMGTPCVASSTGGIPSAIRSGVNGFLVPVGEHASEVRQYCDIVNRLMNDREAYRGLTQSSLEEYRTRLNWTTAVQTVTRLAEGVLHRA